MTAPEVITVEQSFNAALNAMSVAQVREWCDKTEAGMGSSIKNAPKSASAEVFAYNAGLMAAVHQVRALLPPPAAEEAECETATGSTDP